MAYGVLALQIPGVTAPGSEGGGHDEAHAVLSQVLTTGAASASTRSGRPSGRSGAPRSPTCGRVGQRARQRYHPAIVAQATATLGEMFPGRYWVALGSGQAMNEHVTGERWPDKETRVRRLEECVDVIRRLHAGGGGQPRRPRPGGPCAPVRPAGGAGPAGRGDQRRERGPRGSVG
ncbi:LLM class flavin-dependent oxidoreductase [Georgenia sp. SUBG003]|uniref:LLM class flavin-dependent oxidoreductase n=1 Tax=Georgenia sp. SUBG003 TaxID=1497974 RepID=UPI003AB1BB8B